MLERLITKRLVFWKENKLDKALVLTGAKQTGKTYILDWFCKNNFKHYLYINLLKDITERDLLKKCIDTESSLSTFQSIADDNLVEYETVIFIDEVQILTNLITISK